MTPISRTPQFAHPSSVKTRWTKRFLRIGSSYRSLPSSKRLFFLRSPNISRLIPLNKLARWNPTNTHKRHNRTNHNHSPTIRKLYPRTNTNRHERIGDSFSDSGSEILEEHPYRGYCITECRTHPHTNFDSSSNSYSGTHQQDPSREHVIEENTAPRCSPPFNGKNVQSTNNHGMVLQQPSCSETYHHTIPTDVDVFELGSYLEFQNRIGSTRASTGTDANTMCQTEIQSTNEEPNGSGISNLGTSVDLGLQHQNRLGLDQSSICSEKNTDILSTNEEAHDNDDFPRNVTSIPLDISLNNTSADDSTETICDAPLYEDDDCPKSHTVAIYRVSRQEPTHNGHCSSTVVEKIDTCQKPVISRRPRDVYKSFSRKTVKSLFGPRVFEMPLSSLLPSCSSDINRQTVTQSQDVNKAGEGSSCDGDGSSIQCIHDSNDDVLTRSKPQNESQGHTCELDSSQDSGYLGCTSLESVGDITDSNVVNTVSQNSCLTLLISSDNEDRVASCGERSQTVPETPRLQSSSKEASMSEKSIILQGNMSDEDSHTESSLFTENEETPLPKIGKSRHNFVDFRKKTRKSKRRRKTRSTVSRKTSLIENTYCFSLPSSDDDYDSLPELETILRQNDTLSHDDLPSQVHYQSIGSSKYGSEGGKCRKDIADRNSEVTSSGKSCKPSSKNDVASGTMYNVPYSPKHLQRTSGTRSVTLGTNVKVYTSVASQTEDDSEADSALENDNVSVQTTILGESILIEDESDEGSSVERQTSGRGQDHHIDTADVDVPVGQELNNLLTDISEELLDAMNGNLEMDGMDDLEAELTTSFKNPQGRYGREGMVKSSFVYLLLDPRISNNLPKRAQSMSQEDVFREFIYSIFYVGKGKRGRTTDHLKTALQYTDHVCPKVSTNIRTILEIWNSGQGVISLQCFQNTVALEAFTIEACIIEALGLGRIKNKIRGHFHGTARNWSPLQKRMFGVHLLQRALMMFLAEGERQIGPKDIRI